MTAHPCETLLTYPRKWKQISVRHDRRAGILFCYMDPKPRPCYSPELLDDLTHLLQWIPSLFRDHPEGRDDLRYFVTASRTPGAYNLGGDLGLFVDLIRRRDRAALEAYAASCVHLVYTNAVSLNLPITTVSLVQGDALGGGFEAALSGNVLIAERGTRMGFPEILFNLFPGMGAYSLLARRLDPARAERMILGGKTHSAEALHEMGLVDVLAPEGEGEVALYDWVRKQQRFGNATRAIHKVRGMLNPVSLDELMDVTGVWVDAALQLTERELRVMERLVRAQNRVGREADVLRLPAALHPRDELPQPTVNVIGNC